MCKYCEKRIETNRKEKVINNPSFNDAEWKMYNDYTRKWEERSPIDCILNIDKKELELSYYPCSCDSEFEAILKINYCPFCGRKL